MKLTGQHGDGYPLSFQDICTSLEALQLSQQQKTIYSYKHTWCPVKKTGHSVNMCSSTTTETNKKKHTGKPLYAYRCILIKIVLSKLNRIQYFFFNIFPVHSYFFAHHFFFFFFLHVLNLILKVLKIMLSRGVTQCTIFFIFIFIFFLLKLKSKYENKKKRKKKKENYDLCPP